MFDFNGRMHSLSNSKMLVNDIYDWLIIYEKFNRFNLKKSNEFPSKHKCKKKKKIDSTRFKCFPMSVLCVYQEAATRYDTM